MGDVRPKKMISLELDEALLASMKEYADSRGETIRQVVTRAVTREMAYPPPSDPAPLPDSPAARPAGKRK
jgi:hypothetical protein